MVKSDRDDAARPLASFVVNLVFESSRHPWIYLGRVVKAEHGDSRLFLGALCLVLLVGARELANLDNVTDFPKAAPLTSELAAK